MAGIFKRREGGEDADALKREVERLSGELAEARWLADKWKDEMQRARSGFSSHIDGAVDGRVAQLLAELGPSFVGLENGGQAPAIRPILAKYGATFEGEPGAAAQFDPARHKLQDSGAASPGDPVVVRAPGLVFKGRVLVQAIVAPA